MQPAKAFSGMEVTSFETITFSILAPLNTYARMLVTPGAMVYVPVLALGNASRNTSPPEVEKISAPS